MVHSGKELVRATTVFSFCSLVNYVTISFATEDSMLNFKKGAPKGCYVGGGSNMPPVNCALLKAPIKSQQFLNIAFA